MCFSRLLYVGLAVFHIASASAAEGSRNPQYFAKITPFQEKMIEKWTAPEHAPEAIRPTLRAAAPEIRKFLAQVACKADHSVKARSVPVAERTPYNDPGPMTELNSHEHRYTVCLTVDDIRNWRQPRTDTVAFQVIYRSDDSLETIEKHYVGVRQPGGHWRFSYAPSPKQ